MKKKTLWTRNYSLLNLATVFGAAGGIAGNYALSFLVYDEIGSTLAAGLLVALQVVPHFVLPLIIAPWMDRYPRKPFLVAGDMIGGICYTAAGFYLRNFEFSYLTYLIFSLMIACLGAMDSLSYNSIFPNVIPEGYEEKGYAVSGMLYPIMNVLIMPVAALLLDTIGVANILILQGVFAIVASVLESGIRLHEEIRLPKTDSGIRQWWRDFCDGFRYLKGERGLLGMFTYRAVSNGAAIGYGPVLVAFFRSAPGFSAFMYSFFSVAEFLGRTVGGFYQYRVTIPKEKQFHVTYFIYQIYDIMDAILLWIPYPFMLINRAVCGFLGMNSLTLREAAVQHYLPEAYRARVNAFQDAYISAAGSFMALIIGLLGEITDYRMTMTISAVFCIIICWITIWRNQVYVRKIYNPNIE